MFAVDVSELLAHVAIGHLSANPRISVFGKTAPITLLNDFFFKYITIVQNIPRKVTSLDYLSSNRWH